MSKLKQPSWEIKVGIFWDIENYAPPSKTNGCDIASRLRYLGQRFGSVVAFKAYLDQTVTPFAAPMRAQLQSSGVSLIDCPRPDRARREVADKMLLADLMAFAYDNASPSVVVLVSCDTDFAYAISVLKSLQYSVILVHRGEDVSSILKAAGPDIIVDGTRLFHFGWERVLGELPELVKDGRTIAPSSSTQHPTSNANSNMTEAPAPNQVAPSEHNHTAHQSISSNNDRPISTSPLLALEGSSQEVSSEPRVESPDPGAESLPISETPPQSPNSVSTSGDAHITLKNVEETPPPQDEPPPIPPRPIIHLSTEITRHSTPPVDYQYSETGPMNDGSFDSYSGALQLQVDPTASSPESLQDHPNSISVNSDIAVPDLLSPSNSSGFSSSIMEVPDIFSDLIDVLDQAQSLGIAYLNSKTVEQMVLGRNPGLLMETNIKHFETYLMLAHDRGIVDYSRPGLSIKLKDGIEIVS